MSPTIIASIAVVVVALLIGSIVGAFVRKQLGRDSRRDAMREIAPVLGSAVFSLIFVGGLIAALTIASPKSVEDVPIQLVAFVPKVVVAVIFFILGKVIGSLAATATGQAIQQATGKRQLGAERAVRSSILGVFVILAVTQLGIDTAIVNLLITGLVFALAGSFILLTGLGGRDVARNIAAGRSLRNALAPGTRFRSGEIMGTVKELRPANVAIDTDAGEVIVPYTQLFEEPLRVISPAPKDEA